MPQLVIRITKRTDGGAVLKCVRADGAGVRKRRAELFSRWADVKPGETLELAFP